MAIVISVAYVKIIFLLPFLWPIFMFDGRLIDRKNDREVVACRSAQEGQIFGLIRASVSLFAYNASRVPRHGDV